MVKKAFFYLIAAGLCILAPIVQSAEYPWRLRLDRDGVVVHTRKIEGSPILEFKAKAIIDVPLDKAVVFFEDIKKMPSWYHQCVLAELIADESVDQKIFYIVIDLPWPVAARDTVSRCVRSADPKTGAITYTLSALPERLPLHKAKIRVPYLKAFWRFTPMPDGKTEIFFQQHSDAGGSIPTFLINKLVLDIPFQSLKNFIRLVSPQSSNMGDGSL